MYIHYVSLLKLWINLILSRYINIHRNNKEDSSNNNGNKDNDKDSKNDNVFYVQCDFQGTVFSLLGPHRARGGLC